MRFVRCLLIAALAATQLILAQPALAGEDETSDHWIDTKSINRKGDVVSYTQRAMIDDDDSDWDSVIANSKINCETDKILPVQLNITYIDGKSEVIDNPNPDDWTEIKSGSVASDIRHYVCKK